MGTQFLGGAKLEPAVLAAGGDFKSWQQAGLAQVLLSITCTRASRHQVGLDTGVLA